MKKQNRNKERIYLLVVSVIISLLFYNYYNNIALTNVPTDKKALEKIDVSSYVLSDADSAYQEKRAINLIKGFNQGDFKNILKSGDYFSDAIYEDFVAKRLSDTLSKYGRMANLGELNKRPYLVEAEDVKRNGGEWGQFRYLVSATKLGLDSVLLADIDTKYAKLPAVIKVGKQASDISISGFVKSPKSLGSKPLPNVLVRLTEEISSEQKDILVNQYLKTASYEDLVNTDIDNLVKEPTFYIRTDSNGEYSFRDLEKGKNYSVIPIGKGKEYGRLKGQAEIQESETYNFIENIHTLPLFDNYTYRRVKADKVFTVRTSSEFTKILWSSLIVFILGFWVFHITLSIKNRDYDQSILPILMAIIGVGVIVLFAIQEPLRDTEFASGAVFWCFGVLIAFSLITILFKKEWIKDLVQFNYLNSRYLPKPKFVKKSIAKDSRGFAWLLLSFMLMIALFLFGSGPQGSGVKVNLGPIQVSEVAKFFMIIFFAKYFSANLSKFRNIPNNIWLIKHSIWMLFGFGTLITIYAITGDLGPALVLCITFMIFYSLAKNEFVQMLVAGIVFVGLLFVINDFFYESEDTLFIFSILAIIGLGIYSLGFAKKNESMLFLVSIISSFILIERFPFSFAKRLADRNSMYKDIWSNSLHGGDQVAQGIWSIDSGGLFGQGLGYGLSNVMPAYHTDMIFESIGEELGIVFLVFLLFLFGLLFYKSMLVARRTGNTVLFYLVNGVAIATLVQLSIIVAGSLGLVPLTGITVPFLSMGKSSLLVNLFFFLLIILISQYKGGEYQMKEIDAKFENLNLYVLFSFFTVILIFTFTLFRYWYKADSDMIKPVKVLSEKGEWILSENPRVKIFANKLKPGNIYDRNGVLLATSDRKTFLESEKSVFSAMADKNGFNKQKNSRLKRFYPFSEDLLFWLGDWNTQLVTDENLGYVADYRLLSTLRGFENKITKIENATSTEFQEAPYLPKETIESKLRFYDRTDFVPYMKAGINSKLIEEFNAKDRSVTISLDAKMNQTISEAIRNVGTGLKDFKISAVALNAATGEVLASTMNPKPDYEVIKKLNAIPISYYQKLFNAYFGFNNFVSDRDFAMFEASSPGSVIKPINAIAYLNKVGADSSNLSFNISRDERIRQTSENPFGKVSLRDAIIFSNNVFFVKMLNEKNIDNQLFDLYNSVGISMIWKDDEGRSKKYGGYFIDKGTKFDEIDIKNSWARVFDEERGIRYKDKRYFGNRNRYRHSNLSFAAWGQDPLKATPLHIARLFGAISQKGKLKDLKFILNDTIQNKHDMIIKRDEDRSSSFLEDALKNQTNTRKLSNDFGATHYGKTGTAQVERKEYLKTKGRLAKDINDDGWYITYVYSNKYDAPIVFAVRIYGKYGSSKGSGVAVSIYKSIFKRLEDEYFSKEIKN